MHVYPQAGKSEGLPRALGRRHVGRTRCRSRLSSTVRTLPVLFLTLTMLLSAFSPLAFIGDVEAQETREAKQKVFYLHTTEDTKNVGSISTQNIMNTTVGSSGQEITSNMRIIARWLLYPELAGELTVNGTFNMTMWWKADSASSASWTLTVSEVLPDGSAVVVGSISVTNDVNINFEEDFVNLTLLHTFQPGSSVEAHLNIKGDAATDYTIAWGNQTFNSRVYMDLEDYIRIVPQGEGGIVTLDSEFNATTNFDPDAANKTIYIRVKITNPLGGYDIRWVNLTVVDPTNTTIPELDNVSMPKISGFFNSFESVYEVSWNYSGYPEGRYNITVYALDNNGHISFVSGLGFGGHLEVDSEGVFFIGALPITVHIRVIDGDSDPLGGALVLIILNDVVEASGTTNDTGGFQANLAPGIYELQLWWKETIVGNYSLDATEDIPYDAPFEAVAAVYDLTFAAVDVQDVGLSGAAMTVRFPNGTVTDPPLVLDDAGEVALGDMPGGTYRVTVTWKGEIVGDRTFEVQVSGTYVVAAAVYYVDFTAFDADMTPVENVLVTVYNPEFGTILESQLTDASGNLVARLPPGTYSVNAKWFGVQVLDNYAIDVSGSMQVSLDLAIFTTDFRPVDSRGVPLRDASISVSSGIFSQSGNTLDSGRVALRLPLGDYRITVTWQNVEVFDEVITVDGSLPTVDLAASVFYLTVKVVAADETPLENAFVTVTRAGETVGAAHTDSAGVIEFRLPRGTYAVTVSYSTTYMMSQFSSVDEATREVNGDDSFTVIITTFPPPIYLTGLFFILVAFVALLVGFIYVFLRLRGMS